MSQHPASHSHHDHHASGSAHHHHHHHAQAALGFALVLTLGFAGVEAVAGWLAGSLALLSDAAHMLTDSTALGLAALAAWWARRPAGAQLSYGLGRLETLAALANALLMVALISLVALAALDRLLRPQPVRGEVVTWVALIGLLVNGLVAWRLFAGRGNLNVRAALLHVLGDLLGSVAALVSGLVILFTGWYLIDPLLSLLIVGLILVATLRLLREVVHTLLEGVPRHLNLTGIGEAMAAVPGVQSVRDLHIWSLSAERVALSAHVGLDDLGAWPGILDQLRHVLAERYAIEHVTLQPDAAIGEAGAAFTPGCCLGSDPD